MQYSSLMLSGVKSMNPPLAAQSLSRSVANIQRSITNNNRMSVEGSVYTILDEAAKSSCAPGPNAYDIRNSARQTLTSAPQFSLGSRSGPLSSFITPGVGTYNINRDLQTRSRAAMAKADRDVYTKQSRTPDNVGPGSYRPHTPTPGMAQSLSGRYGDEIADYCKQHPVSIGPLSYSAAEAQSNLKKRNPSFSIYTRYQQFNKNKNPGPADYDASRLFTDPQAPIINFVKQQKMEYPNLNPGPGAYNIDRLQKGYVQTMGFRHPGHKF